MVSVAHLQIGAGHATIAKRDQCRLVPSNQNEAEKGFCDRNRS